MDQADFTQQVHLISVVAAEAPEESDVISRHPEVIDALTALASYDHLNNHFGGNGHDPNAFAAALAEGLAPYRDIPLDDNPELVQHLAFLAWALQAERSPNELAEMQGLC
jgi:hypothetical protein